MILSTKNKEVIKKYLDNKIVEKGWISNFKFIIYT